MVWAIVGGLVNDVAGARKFLRQTAKVVQEYRVDACGSRRITIWPSSTASAD